MHSSLKRLLTSLQSRIDNQIQRSLTRLRLSVQFDVVNLGEF